MIGPCLFCSAISDNAHSVLLLPKIGSKTDWDARELEGKIVEVLNGRRTKSESYAEHVQVSD